MKIEQPGPVTPRITLLGRNESCVYLINGKTEYAILGGGMTYIAPDIISQLDEMGINPEKIKRLIIHHSHFDHVGIVPFLKKAWPWMRITSSNRAKELLARPDVVKSIISLNRMLIPENETQDLHTSLDIKTIDVDDTVSDKDKIICGDLTFEAIDVPGHSSCSMAVYIPEEKALSASDAGGIPFGDGVFAAANSNFDAYQASLKKMAAFDTQVHLAEHYGALTGEDGKNFMTRSIADAVKMRQLLETTYARHRDEKKTVDELLEVVSRQAPGYFLPKEIMALVLGQMTRFIVKKYY